MKSDAEKTLRDFSHSLPMALLRAREQVMERFRPVLREYKVTEQQWRALRALMEVEEIDVSELALRCFILSPSLSRIVRDLEARALIERRPDPSDNRRGLIRISDAGRQLFYQVAPHSEQGYAEIAHIVGVDKIKELYRLLEHLEKSLLDPGQGTEGHV